MQKIFNTLIVTFLLFKAYGQPCSNVSYIEQGTNEWVVTVYETANVNNISLQNYRGYYRQKLDITGNIGVNTTLQWTANANRSPIQALAFDNTNGKGTEYQGCTLPGQYFSYVHKRKGFPPGKYEVFIDEWDDMTHVYLNNNLIKEMAQWGSNTHALKCIYLDENSLLELRTDNRGGGVSQLKVRIVATTVDLSINPVDPINCPTSVVLASKATYEKPTNTGTTIETITSQLFDILWTGTNITGGNNNLTATVTPTQATTTYNLTAKFEYCTLTASTNVVYNKPIAPTELEPFKWYVMGYDGANTNNTNIASLTYYGYYRQTLNNTSNLGFNSSETTQNGWATNRRPSFSADWQGCPLPSNNNFTYIHKRVGFPCGTYSVRLDNWDEHARLFINGVEVFYRQAKCNANCTEKYNQVIELDQNSVIEFRTKHTTENSISALNISPITSTVLAGNNIQKTCPVSGDQWVHFYAHPTGVYLGSVRGESPTSNLGNVTMTTYVDAQNQIALACNSPGYQTAVMQRHWVINPTIDGAAEVRLPYTNQEFLNLTTASNATQNPEDNVIYPVQNTIKLSKYSGSVEDNLVNNNCNETVALYNSTNENGNQNPYFYQDFKIPGFSEFWLHGSMYTSPLATTIHNFEVACTDEGKDILIAASYNREKERILLEKSEDGFKWYALDGYDLSSNEQDLEHFTFKDNSSTEAYYRVSTVSLEAVQKTHKTIIFNCNKNNSADFTIHPNPAKTAFTINLEQAVNIAKTILITDVSGKVVEFREIDQDLNSITFDSSNYMQGIYFVILQDDSNTNIKPQRLIIN